MINEILIILSQKINNISFLTPLILIIAGFFTSLTPCSLTSVPLVMGVLIGSNANDKKYGFKISLFFSLGMTLTFTILGVISSSLSLILAKYNKIFNLIIGSILLLMSLQLLGYINIINTKNLMYKNTRKGYAGAFITGVLGGLFSSPCATPVLVSLMALSARTSNLLLSVIMFISFGLGHSIITILTGISTGKVWELINNKKYQKIAQDIEKIFGYIILIIAIILLIYQFK